MMHIREMETSLEVLASGEGRTLHGVLLPWGVPAYVRDRGRMVEEVFERGALADVSPARVPLTATHPRDAGTLPIGVTVEVEECEDAVYGSWLVSDTALGNEVLALARDNVPLGLSVGFMEVPGGSRWSPDRQRVARTRALLDHVAIVRVPAFAGAGVVGVRGPPRATHPPSPCSPWPTGMGKGFPHGVLFGPYKARTGPLHCRGCRRPIVWGERCEDCKRELRQRRKRKPR